jgi:hypothetical protein
MPAATPDAQRRRIRRTSGDRRLRRCVGGGRFVNLRRRNDVRRDDDSLPPPHSPLDVGIRRCRLSPKEEHDVVVQYLVVGRGNGRWGEDDEKERRAMCGRPASSEGTTTSTTNYKQRRRKVPSRDGSVTSHREEGRRAERLQGQGRPLGRKLSSKRSRGLLQMTTSMSSSWMIQTRC